ncbi:MarR family winged helix-turn-helix transcriptional regulator [Labedaea rhizosphaerae]|uniref:MarR family transcriptional regulator n=1 Tax=Labedaea rhizosphaerae TaxID=598644 RepID=A0A4R6SA38_LABRH|nr:MarR family transcriptional regulator [Labedaea rhizosphaerae]TDP96681.1 MarR family transcriptional regulator [Labedaea rhizosphaerae]
MNDGVRLANLLGAAGLGVAAVVADGTAEFAGLSASAAAALVLLREGDGLTGTELGRRIGITQSAAARVVAALERDGYVTRGAWVGREVGVQLTDAGRRVGQVMLEERQKHLQGLLDGFDEHEQAALAPLLEKLLVKIYEYEQNSGRVCRLCDRDACTNNAVCPVGQAERDSA